MSTSIASLSGASSADTASSDPVADRYIQEVINEIKEVPPLQQPLQQPQLQQPPPQPPPQPPQYYYPPPPPPPPTAPVALAPSVPFPPSSGGLAARVLTHEVRCALVAALAAFLVFSPVGEGIVDGLVERTPLREHKFAARCLAVGAVAFLVVEGVKRVA